MSKPDVPTPADALPEGFKRTELGPLPEEWQVVRLGEVVKDITTGDWGEETPRENSLAVYVLRGTDFKYAEFSMLSHVPIRYLSYKSLEKRTVEKGDILVELSGGSKDQPTGRVLLITENLVQKSSLPIAFSNFVKRVRIQDICVPEYLVYYWRFLYQKGATRAYEKRTTGIRNFKLADFLTNECLPLPPLPEQRAIAYVLRTVQEAKEATERVIAALKELKKSLMRHLFTYGPVPLDKTDTVPMQETELGPIPAHWRVVRLGEVASLKQGKVLPTKRFTKFGYPVFGANGQIGWYSQYTHEEPQVLVTCRGATCGTVNITPPRAFITNNAMIVSPLNERILQKGYLSFALRNSDLSKAITGTGQPQITKATLSVCQIPLPPLAEQQEIARILQAVDEKIAAEEKRRSALEALFKSLLAQLMSGRVRVPYEEV